MRRITMNNGDTYDAEWCGESQNILVIAISGLSVKDVADRFSNVAATSSITVHGSETETTYSGYTDLVSVNSGVWGEGTVTLSLRKAGG